MFIHRLEDGQRGDREEILNAIRDLKMSMNGQFGKQGEILARHEKDLAVLDKAVGILQDRGAHDVPARLGAVLGALLAILAAYFGIKG